MTEKQMEAAAREYCRLANIDPDHPTHGWQSVTGYLSQEDKIRRSLEAGYAHGGEQEHFRSGNESQDMLALLNCAYDIMEIWKVSDSLYNHKLKAAWLKRAVELGVWPSW